MFTEVVESVVSMSDTDLRDRLRANELARRALDAEAAVLVSVVDQRGLYSKIDGHRTMAAFLRAEWNCSTSEAAMWRSLGRCVNQLDGVGNAWIAGRFGRIQARKIADARGNPRVRDLLGAFVAVFVDQAEILDSADFTKLVDQTVNRLDTDGAHDTRDHAIDNRDAHVSALGDGVVISAWGGDPVTATELERILEQFADAEDAIDVAARKQQWGNNAPLHELARTAAQRRHDAIVAIFRAAVASDESGQAAALVLNIVCDATTWAEISDAGGLATDTNLAGQPVDPFTGATRPNDLLDELMTDPTTLLDRRCETDTGIPVHPHDVLRAALSGHVRRVVVDAAGTVIDMGRRSRLYTGSARDAAKLLTTRCQHPGCSTPTRWSQIDHADEWVTDHGETNQKNSRIECGPHNRAKTRQQWRTRTAVNAHTYTIRKDGTIMLPAGARTPEFAEPDEIPDPDNTIPMDTIDAIWNNITRHIQLADPYQLTLATGH
ncbi:MAG: DUF222 domain-containing protein [Ilumatobacter sp.]|uniref:DUF222 domain-containing protein n=1 Tax=Ilumatobacter sp. TaxID=1967498 RepID=UPI003C74FC09